ITGVRAAEDEGRMGAGETLWRTLLHTLDPGSLGNDHGRVPFRLLMLVIVLVGLVLVSALIGVLATGISGRLTELRQGRSFVAERNHTRSVGWTAQVFTIARELVEANTSRRDACIVVLGEADPVQMADELRARVSADGTRFVTRTGSSLDSVALTRVHVQAAR